MGIGSLILGLIALVLMIVALPASFVPVLGPVLFVLAPCAAIVGITLAGVALSRAHRQGGSDSLGVAGLVLNIVVLIPALLMAMTCGVCSGCYSAAALGGPERRASTDHRRSPAPAPAPLVAAQPATPATPTPTGPATAPCLPLPAQPWATGGDLSVTGYRWQRPSAEACPSAALGPEGSPYGLHVFCNEGPERSFELALRGEGQLGVLDPLLVVYDGESVPAEQRSCRAAGAAPLVVLVPAGGRITVVATSLDAADRSLAQGGRYQLTITPR